MILLLVLVFKALLDEDPEPGTRGLIAAFGLSLHLLHVSPGGSRVLLYICTDEEADCISEHTIQRQI